MERNKVVDKIRKLLRLAQNEGATPAEAEQALLHAQRLMAANGLEEGEVDTEAEEEAPQPVEDQELEAMPSIRQVPWRGQLSAVIAKNFRCKTYWTSQWKPRPGSTERGDSVHVRVLRFIGRKSDLEIARDVYQAACYFAQLQCNLHIAERLGRGDRLGDTRQARNAFYMGFCVGLELKFLEQVKSTGLALAVVPDADVKAKVEALKLHAASPLAQRGDGTASRAGNAAGKAFSMNRKVGDGAKPARLALPGKAGDS